MPHQTAEGSLHQNSGWQGLDRRGPDLGISSIIKPDSLLLLLCFRWDESCAYSDSSHVHFDIATVANQGDYKEVARVPSNLGRSWVTRLYVAHLNQPATILLNWLPRKTDIFIIACEKKLCAIFAEAMVIWVMEFAISAFQIVVALCICHLISGYIAWNLNTRINHETNQVVSWFLKKN